MAMQGRSAAADPGGSLTSWIRSVPPFSYLFIAARAVSRLDFDAIVKFAQTAAQVQDGVGIFCFMPVSPDQPTTYTKVAVPTALSLDRVLYRACQDLVVLSREAPVAIPSSAVGPAAGAEAEAAGAEESSA